MFMVTIFEMEWRWRIEFSPLELIILSSIETEKEKDSQN